MKFIALLFAIMTGGIFLGNPMVHGESLPVKKAAAMDDHIEINVKAEFDRDPRVNLSDVIIASENEEVKLIGTVLTAYEKAHAERLAAKVPGVKKVLNLIQVIEAKNQDAALAKKIRSDILQNPAIHISKLQVGVENRHVHIRGISEDRGNKVIAEQLVSKMPDVKGVENGILIRNEN